MNFVIGVLLSCFWCSKWLITKHAYRSFLVHFYKTKEEVLKICPKNFVFSLSSLSKYFATLFVSVLIFSTLIFVMFLLPAFGYNAQPFIDFSIILFSVTCHSFSIMQIFHEAVCVFVAIITKKIYHEFLYSIKLLLLLLILKEWVL